MTPEEIKAKSDALTVEITELELAEQGLLAELGKKVLPELPEDSAHASLAAEIKKLGNKMAKMRKEQASLDAEYKQQLVALTCYSCKTLNPSGSRFCEECGGKLGEPPREYCKACNTMNSPNLKFCGECGVKLASG